MQAEKNIWLKVLSLILTLALLISCVPNQVYAMAGEALADLLEQEEAVLQPDTTTDLVLSTARIVAEDASRRGEFYKEYIMNNGLRYATVYPSAIHYEDNGQWKDIDNTLVAAISGGKSVYQNKAGALNVRFPRSLSGNDMIGITKDGHTVQFGMAGELRSSGDLVVASIGQIGTTADTLAVSNAQTTTAQIQQIDLSAARAAAEHPETILDKLNSRLTYANVYPNTNVVYDLQGNQLKESVVMQRYDADLWGYRYTLDTGDLIPVLREDKQIDLCHPETNEVVLTMPAPYMLDNNGEISYDVEVMLTRNGSNYLLSYYLPREWLADADRAWPVILDPVVTGNSRYTNVKDVTVAETGTESSTRGVIQCGYLVGSGAMRMYMQYINLPIIPSGNVIVDATISLMKPMNYATASNVEVYKVTEPWTSSTITWADKDNYEENIISDYVVCQNAGRYIWNITNIVRDWYETGNYGMMFKTPSEVENGGVNNWKQFYSSDFSNSADTLPALTITYQNHNGLEDYWSYSSSSAGRAGTGYVNLFTGNLVWVRNDLGFDGNRMPVSISHIYNSSDSQSNSFGMGNGWRTNYNQTITSSGNGTYVWEDGDGTRHQFVTDSNGVISDVDGLHLTLTVTETGYLLTDVYGNASEFTGSKLTKMTTTRSANAAKGKHAVTITHDSDTGFISQITDGAGRKYVFSYNQSNLLNKIAYVGNGSTELAYVTYSYNTVVTDDGTDHYLTKVIDRDGCYTEYTYAGNLLAEAKDISIRDSNKVFVDNYTAYSYESVTAEDPITPVKETKEYKSNDSSAISEYSLSELFSYEYDAHYTTTTNIKGKTTNYQFNDFGNLVAVHNSDGHVQYTRYAINDVQELTDDTNPPPLTAELHQVLEVSDIDGASSNHFPNGSFENTDPSYDPDTNSGDPFGWGSHTEVSSTHAYRGGQSMKLSSEAGPSDMASACGPGITIGAGETYTYSLYVYAEENTDGEPYAYIELASGHRYILTGETNGWKRIQITYTNESNEEETIYPSFDVYSGTIYVDCIQVEKAGAAGPYNEVVNGEFLPENNSDNTWKDKNNNSVSNCYNNSTPAPNLISADGSIGLAGIPDSENYVTQDVMVNGYAGDAFVLAGWAQANAVPLTENREFGLRLIFNNSDQTKTEYYTSFDPKIDFDNWQYAALTAVAAKAFVSITIQLVYNHQANGVQFDGIQLTEGRAGTTYAYDTYKNVCEETNILGQTTKYNYDPAKGVDLIGIDAPVGSDVTYEYDSYHNVIEMTETIKDEDETEHTVIYEFAYDDYGNIESVTVTQGTLKLKSMTEYTSDGNYIKASTDGTGQTTRYGYHLQTGVLKWVQYPEDTPGTAETEDTEGTEGTEPTDYIEGTSDTRTYYAYDEMFRMIEAYATTDQNASMLVEYGYENDLLKTLTTRSTTYNFTYNDYNLRTSVSVGNQLLAEYTYNARNYLETIDYGNEDRVEYKYDNLGRVIREEYYEKSQEDDNTTSLSRTIRYYYDNGGALARMKDSETGMETICYYDYAGRVAVYYERYGNTSREIVYSYDENGNVTKVDETVNEYRWSNGAPVSDRSIYGYEYFYDSKNRLESVKTDVAQKDYHYDTLDRLTEEVVKRNNGAEVLRNEYTYNNATVGETSVTTNQVFRKKTTAAHYSSNLRYTYDGNGNITSVSDGTYTTTYVYDSANQLIRENNQAEGRTWIWIYDDAGNILYEKGYAYTLAANPSNPANINTYGYTNSDTGWWDLLRSYNGRVIEYDEIGNPLSDGVWDYTWRQGRQLASMSRKREDNSTENWSFVYDANGMRLGRSNGTDAYTYVYTDGLLTRMTKGDIMLHFTYDAVGMPMNVSLHCGDNCGIKKGTPCGSDCVLYYYVTNLQGDVIAILDNTGDAVAEYSYDAWGRLLCDLDEDAETIYSLNPLFYRGYVYDHETGLYYLQSRYYNPEVGRFISADAYLSTGDGILGNNMFAYCHNNPIMFYDPTGEGITLGAFFAGVAIAAFIGAGIATGATVIKDYSDDGEIFNGSVKEREYFGNAVEGLIAGAGIGACITLGAGLGAAMVAGEALVIGGVTLSGLGAFGLGAGIAFSTGAIGYAANTVINIDLKFEWSDMLIAAGCNMASGMLSFAGGMAGGITGVKVPGAKTGFRTMVQNAVKYHAGLFWFGVYPSKILLARLESALKEAY